MLGALRVGTRAPRGEGGRTPLLPEPLVPIHTDSPLACSPFSSQEPIIFHEDGKQILAPAGCRPLSTQWILPPSSVLSGKIRCSLRGSREGAEDVTEEADADTRPTQLPRERLSRLLPPGSACPTLGGLGARLADGAGLLGRASRPAGDSRNHT